MRQGSQLRGVLTRGPARAGRTPVILFLCASFLSGCTVGPNYNRPAATVPAKWDVAEPWRESAPKDSVAKGQWWDVFHDYDLNVLEKQALAENQTVKVSIAHLEQARATAAIQIATLFPTLNTGPSSLGPNVGRQRLAGNRPPNGIPVTLQPVQQNSYV